MSQKNCGQLIISSKEPREGRCR